MLKKLFTSFLVLTSFGLVLAGCQTNEKKDTPPPSSKTETDKKEEIKKETVYKDIDEFVEAVQEAHQDLESVHADTQMGVHTQEDGNPELVTMVVDAIYEDGQLIRTDAVIESLDTNGDLKTHSQLIVPNETEAYAKKTKNGGYEKREITQEDIETFDLNPDYFDLLQCIYDNTSDLSVEKDGDEYVVTLEGDDLSILETFGKEYDFRVNGVTEDEMEKELTIRFDGETLFVKDMQVSLTYDDVKGYLQVFGESEYSDWNEIQDGDIEAPE